MKQREYIVKILGLAYDVNSKGKDHIFVRFSGHVNQIEVDIHIGGWDKEKDYDKQFSFYLDEDFEQPAKECIKFLKSL